MKNLFVIIGLVALAACDPTQSTDGEVLLEGGERWQLVKMTGGLLNSETAGSDMEWQEYYLLRSNGTFLKSRSTGTSVVNVIGTYKSVELSGELYFELNHQDENPLVGSCTSSTQELLRRVDDQLLGTWLACDGPGLEYVKIP